MKAKIVLAAILLVALFISACSSQPNTSAYNSQQRQQQQGQYVGGGCGVAPSGSYENTPVDSIKPSESLL